MSTDRSDEFADLREISHLKGLVAMEKLLKSRLSLTIINHEEILRWRRFLLSEKKRLGVE